MINLWQVSDFLANCQGLHLVVTVFFRVWFRIFYFLNTSRTWSSNPSLRKLYSCQEIGYAYHYQVISACRYNMILLFMTWNHLHRKIAEVEKILLNLIFDGQVNNRTESGNSRHLLWLPCILTPIILQSCLFTPV